MKVSKAAAIWIDYHKTHPKNKPLTRSFPNIRNWLILELMDRGGGRTGEVVKLRLKISRIES